MGDVVTTARIQFWETSSSLEPSSAVGSKASRWSGLEIRI